MPIWNQKGVYLGNRANFVPRPNIQFVSSINGSTLVGGVTSVNISGQQTGDFLLALGANQSLADPSPTSGWTKIISFGNTANFLRTGILVYKFATSSASETLTFTGSGDSGSQYSAVLIFRNVSGIGNFNSVNSSASSGTGGPFVSPSLTLNNTSGKSALVLANYLPFISAAPNNMSISSGIAYGLSRSVWEGGNWSSSAAVGEAAGIVELLN